MSARHLSITEPHPSVPKSGSAYIYGGRGGAGNYKRYKAEEITDGPSATGPASRMSLSAKSLKRQNMFPTGRGGSGNMYKSDAEDRVFQFDEEIIKRCEAKAPVYHIGRGGAANWVDERAESSKQERSRQDSSSSGDSVNSDSSDGSRNLRRIISNFSRRSS